MGKEWKDNKKKTKDREKKEEINHYERKNGIQRKERKKWYEKLFLGKKRVIEEREINK